MGKKKNKKNRYEELENLDIFETDPREYLMKIHSIESVDKDDMSGKHMMEEYLYNHVTRGESNESEEDVSDDDIDSFTQELINLNNSVVDEDGDHDSSNTDDENSYNYVKPIQIETSVIVNPDPVMKHINADNEKFDFGVVAKNIGISIEVHSALERIIIRDKLQSVGVNYMTIENFKLNMDKISLVSENEDSEFYEKDDIIGQMHAMIVFASMPTAIYTSEQFVDVYKKYKEINSSRFMFGGVGNYVLAYLIDQSVDYELYDKMANNIDDMMFIKMMIALAHAKTRLDNTFSVFNESHISAAYASYNKDVKFFEKLVADDDETVLNDNIDSCTDDDVFDNMNVFDLSHFASEAGIMLKELTEDEDEEYDDDESIDIDDIDDITSITDDDDDDEVEEDTEEDELVPSGLRVGSFYKK